MGDLATEGVSSTRPAPPRAPEPGECCQSGCEVCVYDLYWDALTRYEEQLAAWERGRGSVRRPSTPFDAVETSCRRLRAWALQYCF